MRAIFTLVSTMTCAVALFVAGLSIAAYSMREYEPHHFAHLDTPDLWTSKPVVVDPAKQDYQRVEGVRAVAYVPPTDADVETASFARNEEREAQAYEVAEEGVVGRRPADPALMNAGDIDSAHVDWCLARYRSYQVEDNSYQPYGGGPRQECVSPSMQVADAQPAAGTFEADSRGQMESISAMSPAAKASEIQQTVEVGSAPIGAHEAWCHERYRSYRTEDNSYQPFDGGPRRACMSPYG